MPKQSITARRRAREKEKRNQTILESAEKLFARDGYMNTKMTDIADMAEISVGTVYSYFRNKEDLLIKLLDRIAYNLRRTVGSEFRKPGPPLMRFENSGYAFFRDFCEKHPEQLIILERESLGISPNVQKHRMRMYDQLVDDIRSALMEIGHNNGYSPNEGSIELISTAVIGMLDRVAYSYFVREQHNFNVPEASKIIMSFVKGGVINLFGVHEEVATTAGVTEDADT